MSRARRIAVATALVVAATVYWLVVRPWHRRWGATEREASDRLPGDDLVAEPADQQTRAISIDAPPSAVWPWLVQIGQGRGGFYSYDVLENLVGADIHNVDRIVPEFQDLAEGDTIRLAPEDYVVQSPDTAPEVAVLEEERAIVLAPETDPPRWSWGFTLEPENGRTRFIVRSRGRKPEGLLSWVSNRFVLEPIHFVMERRMLFGVKERAEGEGRREEAPVEPEFGPAV